MTEMRIPDDVVDAIERGFPPVKAFRIGAGLTVEGLAGEAGIGVGRMIEIEAGRTPTASEIGAIGRALHQPDGLLANE